MVANPPYVSADEWAGLAAEVRAEPRQALVAGPGSDGTPGMADVEALLEQCRDWLRRPVPRSSSWRRTRPGRRCGWPADSATARRGSSPTWPGGRARWSSGPAADVRGVDDGGGTRPPLVGAGASEVVGALEAGSIIAVPAVGGYSLAVRAGSPDGEARLVQLAADPEGPHYAVGHRDVVRSLTTAWTDELGRLLERCWPGPVEVFVPRVADSSAAADRRWVRRLGGRGGHARRAVTAQAVPRAGSLAYGAAHLQRGGRGRRRFDAADVAFVVDGGRRDGPPPTLVDATVSPVAVLREGALPASFIEGTMLMSTRRRFFSRARRSPPG